LVQGTVNVVGVVSQFRDVFRATKGRRGHITKFV